MTHDPSAMPTFEILRARHAALRLEAVTRRCNAADALTVTERRLVRSWALLSHSQEEMAKSADLLGRRGATGMALGAR